MPRIETLRVLPFLYVSWEQDDHGDRHNVRGGLTAVMSRRRCVNAVNHG